MHQRIKTELEQLSISFSELEQAIGCTKNYLSRFINGPQVLPNKWETKIDEFIRNIKQMAAKIEAPPVKPELLRPWIAIVEKYCRERAGLDPEDLVEDHAKLKSKVIELTNKLQMAEFKAKHKSVDQATLNENHKGLSNWAEENRRKKLGL